MTTTQPRQLGGIALALVAALVALPILGMGFGTMGHGPMTDGAWDHGMWATGTATPMWLLIAGVVMQLGMFVLLLGAGYLGYRALTPDGEPTDRALEELRVAYARGDLTDDEFEKRRERLQRGE